MPINGATKYSISSIFLFHFIRSEILHGNTPNVQYTHMHEYDYG